MEKFVDFVTSHSDNSKNYGCATCRENLAILKKLVRNKKQFSCIINKDASGEYIHIENVHEFGK